MTEVTLEDVRVERSGRLVLDVPSLALRGGRTTAILGPNGSGKTTLLRVIAGLERSSRGRVLVGSRPGLAAPDLAYVFQELVFLRQSVRHNLELGLRLRGVDQAERRRRIDESVAVLDVAHLLERRADQLSGGEARRVSLARALCLRAPLVLLDEPLAGLDEQAYGRLLDELPAVLAAFHATTVLVTHNRDAAMRLADDLVVLVDGGIQASGDKREVAWNPPNVAVANVLGYVVLEVGDRSFAVAPNALNPGGGRLQFLMTVESVVELIDGREVVGRIDRTRVRVQWTGDATVPPAGCQVEVSADRYVVLA
jgi:ABC-type sugar transport system ATPase subunit